jgi:hypothetical protein
MALSIVLQTDFVFGTLAPVFYFDSIQGSAIAEGDDVTGPILRDGGFN